MPPSRRVLHEGLTPTWCVAVSAPPAGRHSPLPLQVYAGTVNAEVARGTVTKAAAKRWSRATGICAERPLAFLHPPQNLAAFLTPYPGFVLPLMVQYGIHHCTRIEIKSMLELLLDKASVDEKVALHAFMGSWKLPSNFVPMAAVVTPAGENSLR